MIVTESASDLEKARKALNGTDLQGVLVAHFDQLVLSPEPAKR